MKKTLLALLASILTVPASAHLITVSEPIDRGSSTIEVWAGFGGGRKCDLIAVRMTSGDDYFESPTLYDFDVAGWSMVYENSDSQPTLASALGPPTGEIGLLVHFAAPRVGYPREWEIIWIEGDSFLARIRVSVSETGKVSLDKPCTWNPTRADLLPPKVLLDELAATIVTAGEIGDIDSEITESLLAKVYAALAALDRDNPTVAINNLQALINQVAAQAGKKIDPDTAEVIVTQAEAIVGAPGG